MVDRVEALGIGDGLGAYSHDDVSMPKIFSDTQPHLGRVQDYWRTNRTSTSMARLESFSSAFYRVFEELDPNGTELQLRDDNFTYPGLQRVCTNGCPESMVEAGQAQYHGVGTQTPRWWCSQGCLAK